MVTKNNTKNIFIAFKGECSSAIIMELKKHPDWNTSNISQNQFHLIEKLTRVCQTSDFGIQTDAQFKDIK